MSDSREELLKLLSEDPYGLLKNQESSKKKISNFVLLNNFEEIVSFVEENNRLPENSISGIKEFQLYCRLKAIKSNPEMVKQLKDYDLLGLLSGDDVAEITLEDITSVDPHHLLSNDFDSSIFDLRNVRSNPRTSPDFIARRKFCRDFDKYEPLFNTLHEDLEGGSKRLALYHPEDLIPGRFFVLGGILLYLKSVDGEVTLHKYQSGDYRRYDGRTECIFDNGTVSNMLYRSLNKLMQKDGYSITECEDVQSASTINPEDREYGYVYVLRSHHSKLRGIPDVYKIGSTTSSVTERIKNARKEPTYLYAGVDIVQTFRCFNMSARVLENQVQTFFDKVRLNINIPDETGAIISPREWFCVNVDVIGEAINLILSGTIDNYVYDPQARKIIAKKVIEPVRSMLDSDNVLQNYGIPLEINITGPTTIKVTNPVPDDEMPMMMAADNGDNEVRPHDIQEELDLLPSSTLDSIFHKALNLFKVKKAIQDIIIMKGEEGKFRLSVKQTFILHKVLEEIDWLDDDTDTTFIQWYDDVYKWPWKTRDFKSVLSNFKHTHSLTWDENTVNDANTGREYRDFANYVRSQFVDIDASSKITDKQEFLKLGSDGKPMYIGHDLRRNL